MKQALALLALVLSVHVLQAGQTQTHSRRTTPPLVSLEPESLLSQYFAAETAKLERSCLAEVRTLADWESRKQEYRRELLEMLGLWPMPERTELKATVTGKIEREDFTVEKLHFQALPHLYVTANLYLPKNVKDPVPGILYVCGHARVFTNGVSCGNKVGYQHHGIWFARNGYACLMIDSLQLGEIEGLHHGTYREAQWWWNSRGYTPAGVEAWFGIRALDYLCSRPEIDKERLGMTGRSGGGSYTWTVAALDDRVKVAAPVAGMTDLRNQVVDGVVSGHCDCMFFLNSYRWDFPQLAALLAPRPLLIANSDKDTIFPLDGVTRLYFATRRVYQLFGKTNNLGLLITDGPHADTQDLQVPVFRWFNRFLKNDKAPIEMAAKPMFAPEELRVFKELPADQVNTKIQETFVPVAKAPAEQRVGLLRQRVFGGWPAEPVSFPTARMVDRSQAAGIQLRHYALATQPGVELGLWSVVDRRERKPAKVLLTLLDDASWTNSPAKALWLEPTVAMQSEVLPQECRQAGQAVVYFAPRGVGHPRTEGVQVRRRYMLLGQTLDGMRVWDIRCALKAIKALPEFRKAAVILRAEGAMGVNAVYAAVFEPGLTQLQLRNLPQSIAEEPDYLNVMKVAPLGDALELVKGKIE